MSIQNLTNLVTTVNSEIRKGVKNRSKDRDNDKNEDLEIEEYPIYIVANK